MPFKIVIYEADDSMMEVFKAIGTDQSVVFVEQLLSMSNVGVHGDADVICMDQSVLTAQLLEQFKNLGLIAVRSTGYDHIDIDFCSAHNIAVANVPGYAANAVAEHTFALLLTVSRHIESALQYTRQVRFSWEGLRGFELMGKTMAVIGTGAVGRRVAELACALGMKVIVNDLRPNTAWADSLGLAYVDFETAIGAAHIVSLNVPLAPGSGYLIGAPQFEQMQQGVVLINTARGELVDPKALVTALNTGKVAAAGLDVLPDEHYIREKERDPAVFFSDRFDHKTMLANSLLCRHPHVIVTPHIGWYTVEADMRALDITVANINAFTLGKGENVVNTALINL
ncbi:MAG: NAD(P)-dependent oxidoreductase [Pseudomonadota bacterium]